MEYVERANEDEIFADNERLIDFTLQKYFKQNIGFFEYEDLFQEGAIGLIRAIRTYKGDQSEFSTYAIVCIRKAIKRYMDYNRFVIHVPPTHFAREMKKGEEAAEEFLRKCIAIPIDSITTKSEGGLRSDRLRIPIESVWRQLGIEDDAVQNLQVSEIGEAARRNLSKREIEIFCAYIENDANLTRSAEQLGISKQRVQTIRDKMREIVRGLKIFEKDYCEEE